MYIPTNNDAIINNNVAIVEDDYDFRKTLADFLNKTPGYRCLLDCDSAEQALKDIPRLRPDVVLMDIHLPNMSGVICTSRLKKICPSMPILMLTVYEDNEKIFGALKAGANGYLLKRAQPADILCAIHDVRLGGAPMSSQIACRVVESFYDNSHDSLEEPSLSKREKEILEELTKGRKTKEIASYLSISTHTVHTHIQHIYEKLHVRSRTEAVIKLLG